ncbi:MAG TPA: threonine synthase, partial [Anaeromyxobacter sp.]
MSVPARIESVQVCEGCGGEKPAAFSSTRCSDCGGLFELRHAPPAARGEVLRALFSSRSAARTGIDASGVWRYRELVLPGVDDPVTRPEGNTPLLANASVAGFAGVHGLLLKHEGDNPTGSFKDRGMTVAVTWARRIGARAAACASTGNTSASLASYAALAGIPALVFVPAGRVAAGKLAQTLAYGARTLLVRGDFDACLNLAREAAEKLGVYLVNSVNPFRLEGQKTIVLEMLEQLGWDAPDWIALPAGNLGNTSAFGAALAAALELGLIARVPRLAAVQAAGANPFARAFREGFAAPHRVTAETRATAIRIGDPASYGRGVRAIRSTRGIVTDVTDDEILEAKAVVDASGIGCEPASAASV